MDHMSAFYLKEFWDINLLWDESFVKFGRNKVWKKVSTSSGKPNDSTSKCSYNFWAAHIIRPLFVFNSLSDGFYCKWDDPFSLSSATFVLLVSSLRLIKCLDDLSVLMPDDVVERRKCKRDNSRNNILCWPVRNAALFMFAQRRIHVFIHTHWKSPWRGDKAAWSWWRIRRAGRKRLIVLWQQRRGRGHVEMEL